MGSRSPALITPRRANKGWKSCIQEKEGTPIAKAEVLLLDLRQQGEFTDDLFRRELNHRAAAEIESHGKYWTASTTARLQGTMRPARDAGTP